MTAGAKAERKALEPIENIKARASIVEIIGPYAELRKHRDGELWAKCPLHTDRTPSFKVSPKRQSFKCFGCGAAGDVFDFIRLAEGVELPAAIERVLQLIGGSKPEPAAEDDWAAQRAAAEAQDAQRVAHNTALARQLLREAEPITRSAGGPAVDYLVRRRGITRWQSHTLRWHSRCPFGQERVGCIVVPVENRTGDVMAIWRIRPAMQGKVERKALGPIKGCCAPVIDHAALPVLTIAEGIEDALAAWVLTSYPAWAALSASNMALLDLPEHVEQAIICADADAVGREAALKLAHRLRAEGRQARVIHPITGKDANDILLARAG